MTARQAKLGRKALLTRAAVVAGMLLVALLGVSLLREVAGQRALGRALQESGKQTTGTIVKVTSDRSKDGRTYWSRVGYEAGGRRYEIDGPMLSAGSAGTVPYVDQRVDVTYLPAQPETSMLSGDVSRAGQGSLVAGLLCIVLAAVITFGAVPRIR
jgi:Protein of unknown function (DUF3592)